MYFWCTRLQRLYSLYFDYVSCIFSIFPSFTQKTAPSFEDAVSGSFLILYACGFMVGNSSTSRMEDESVSSMTMRSMP